MSLSSPDQPSREPARVAAMFDRIADRYDIANDVLSMGQDRGWRRATIAALEARPGMRILDVAAGTGTSAAALLETGAEVVACDISTGMAEVARRRHPDLAYVVADALDLPFEDASFDAVTMSFGLRNVPDVASCLCELARVTRPGGRLLICEFSTPTSPLLRVAYPSYLTQILPRIGGLISGDRDSYEYLATTVAQWPDQHELASQIRAAGWRDVRYRNLSGGLVALHRAVADNRAENPDKFVP